MIDRVEIVEDLVDHFGHERLAVDLAQVLHRHLAGAKAVDADLAPGIGKPRHQLGFHVTGRHGDLDLALETGVERFGDLHHRTFVSTNEAAKRLLPFTACRYDLAGNGFWCGTWRSVHSTRLKSSRNTLQNVNKSLFFRLLITFCRSGSSHPVTFDTPFVTGAADFQPSSRLQRRASSWTRTGCWSTLILAHDPQKYDFSFFGIMRRRTAAILTATLTE